MIRLLYRLGDWLRHTARRRRWTPDLATGRRGEDLAHRLLRRAGYVIVARNYRTPGGSGEMDLVAWDGPTLVFVEVKSRTSEEFGSPDRAVGPDKRERLFRAAQDYARRADVPWDRVRFDIVNVVFGRKPSLEHLVDVFATR